MAQSTSRNRVLGDYIVGRQIGSGSFSVVWHGKHRIHGTEVAIKEIVMERLNTKLQDSLMSEIEILKKINHPNIIRLHDIIKTSGRVHLVLEYCRGGDLSIYIQRHGSVPEATAKYFMQQLAAGLKVLRENSLIHRDLKPQNLLLFTNDSNSLLKIADFGFARSLQPRGLAETLCGSPLYMAPEIMHLQKYDAKADLWSVGAILFQLATGNTPFSGNNQTQLLQNIMKSNELSFPPDKKDLSFDCLDLCQKLLRRNPVERLTFEEFFNHRFLSQNSLDGSLRSSRAASRTRDGSPLLNCNFARHTEESSQEDYLPFLLDDDCSGADGSPSFPSKRASTLPTYGFSIGKEIDKNPTSNTSNMDITSRNSIMHELERTVTRHVLHRPSDGFLKESTMAMGQASTKVSSKDPTVVDSLEFIDQDYVLVSGPPLDVSSSLATTSQPRHSPCKSESSPMTSVNNTGLSAPMPITGAVIRNTCGFGSLESQSSAPSGTSQGSMDIGDISEQPSAHGLTRIRSLQRCASALTELVNEKIESGRRLDAFSIQLVILAIWKQALHICHAQAASAIEGSPSQEFTGRGSTAKNSVDSRGPVDVCSHIEREFLFEVGNAEQLSKDLGPINGSTEMPDAMETIFQSALALGRHGAVDELMGDTDSAVTLYSKAVRLLFFLLVEAPSLILNPPFSLTNSDRFRLRSYIDILNNRQNFSRSQRIALLKCEGEDQQSP
ncbi:serine/threonine-protein kinase ATG1c-like [Tasmannia lanceolata]|uniref:serine/threonine-protein kinase ATG1c-like n=1 Tax=Tasmannia lanceolata TaxID=3420 RepID=UPI004063BA8B